MNKIDNINIAGVEYNIDGIISVNINQIDSMYNPTDQGVYKIVHDNKSVGILFINNIVPTTSGGPSYVTQIYMGPYKLTYTANIGYIGSFQDQALGLSDHVNILTRHYNSNTGSWSAWKYNTDEVLDRLDEHDEDITDLLSSSDEYRSDINDLYKKIDGYLNNGVFVPGVAKSVELDNQTVYPNIDGKINLTGIIEDGKSAYQIWLEQEHEGTEYDFLEWLNGCGFETKAVQTLPTEDDIDTHTIYAVPDANSDPETWTEWVYSENITDWIPLATHDGSGLSDIIAKVDGYYVCSSDPQSNKIINASNYKLKNGGEIIIKFTNSNIRPTPVKLNINNTGSKDIYINGKQAGIDNTWKEGSVCLCWYDESEQHYNLKVLYDGDGDLSESVGILNNLYLNSLDWENITNSVQLTSGYKYDIAYWIGHTAENGGYSYTEPILLNKGEAVRVKSYGNLFCPILESDESGNILARLVMCSSDVSAYREFSYIATRDMYVVVNVFTTNVNYPYNISKGVGLQTLIDILEMSKTICNGYVRRDTDDMFTANDVSAGDILYYQVRPDTAGFNIRLSYLDDETEKTLDIVSNSQAEAGKVYYGSFIMPDLDLIRAYNHWSSGNVIIAKEGTLAADSTKLKINDDILNDVVFKDKQVYNIRIFNLDDVSVGDTIYFKIKPVGNSFVLKFKDENGTFINQNKGPAQYDQTAEAGKEYIGKAIIPEGFSYATIEWGTCDVTIAKKGTVAGDSIVLAMMNDDVEAMKSGSALPVYYKDYLDEKEILIRDLQLGIEGKEDNFIFITDSHWSDNYKQSPAIIESLLKRGLTNKVVFGGDLMAENTDGTIEDVKAQVNFHRSFASIVQSCASMFFNVRGNHDINGKNTGDLVKWKPTEKATENVLMQPTEVFDRIKNVSGLDYVFDNDIKKIRYIIFDGLEATAWKNYNGNVPYSGDPILLSNVYQRKAKFDIKIPSGYTEGNTAVKLYIGTDNNGETEWQYQSSLDIDSINGEQVRDLGIGSVGKKLGFLFGGNYPSARLTLTLTSLDGSNGKLETTLNWLKDALISTPANYDILVFSHYAAIAATGSSYVPDIFRIVNAYNNKANVTINSIPCDFTNVQGKILAYISGHTHKNLQSFSAGVTHICIACDARYSENPYMNEKPYSRAQGDTTEQLFDFIQIDKAANMIYCKRIGGGYDRYFHTQSYSLTSANSITLQSLMLSGELTWGCYDNDEAVTKTDSAQITSSRVTVLNGVVSAIAGAEEGEVVVYAMDAAGNREFFEVIVG